MELSPAHAAMLQAMKQGRQCFGAARHALACRQFALGALPPSAGVQRPRAVWMTATAAAAAAAGQGEQRGAAPGAWQRQQPAVAAAAASSATTGTQSADWSQTRSGSSVTQPTTHLRQLSVEQLAAVSAPLGTVRVVAGPGSGKTRVLTARIAELIHVHGARPWQILAITFTNKAANEMRERLGAMLGPEAGKDLFAGTFHSLCYRILKRHIADLPNAGRTSDFTVYDQDMAVRLVAKLVAADNPDWKVRDVNDKARKVQDAISKVKNSMLTWHGATTRAADALVQAHLAKQLGSPPTDTELSWAKETAEWFVRFEGALRANNACDFDDLLGLAVALLRQEPVQQRYQQRFRHVLVDEFQDTNTAQYELVKLLTLPRPDLFVVGDPDQSIYGWRGADMTNMTHAFGVDFPRTQVYDLRDNYRSSSRIVATAESVIAANDDWERAGLRPMRPAGHPVEIHLLNDSHAEAKHIGAEIQRMLHSGEHPEEQVAVLFRTHVQARLVEQELVKRNIKYILMGGVAFWRRLEIQDVMAYLRLAVSLRDDVALTRIINTPKRAIGDASVHKLEAYAAANGHTLSTLLFGSCHASTGVHSGGTVQAAAGASAGDGAEAEAGGLSGAALLPPPLPPLPDRKVLGLTPKAAAAVEAFRQLMAGLHDAVGSQPLVQAVKGIIAETGYEQHVKDGGCTSSAAKEGDEQERLARLRQLVAAAGDYEPGKLSGAAAMDAAFAASGADGSSIEGGGGSGADAAGDSGSSYSPLQIAQNFLDEAALYSGADDGQGARGVRLMTMHAAKGLEFEVVFIPGCNEGMVPLVRSGRRDGDGPTQPLAVLLHEERRLFYVSLTRAKERLRLTHTWQTTHFGRGNGQENVPSHFLEDVLKAGHAIEVDARVPQQQAGGLSSGRRQQRYLGSSSSSSSSSSSGGGGWARIHVSTGSSSGGGRGRGSWSRASSPTSGGSSSGSGGSRNSSSSAGSGTPHHYEGSSGAAGRQQGGSLPPLSDAQQKAARRGGRR